MSWSSKACAWQCLAVLLAVCDIVYAVPPELPQKVADLLGKLPEGHKLPEGRVLVASDISSPAGAEDAQEEDREEGDYSEEDSDYVDPRLWQAVDRWREERHEDYRRLSHNNHLGNKAIRHASIHFHWRAPKGKRFGKISAWYAEVTVTSYHEDSFFNVNGHGFGYMGIQCVDYDPFIGKIVFSIWDQECTGNDLGACPREKRAEITQCGPGIKCTRFGGEGTGAKGYFLWNDWKVNRPYSFLTVAKPFFETNQVEYTGYFYAPEYNNGEWKVIASIKVNKKKKKWYIHGQYSFVEQWSKKHPEGVRWAKFGPIFKRNGADAGPTTWWDPVIRAKLFHTEWPGKEDTTHVLWNKSTFEFEMGVGGNIKRHPKLKIGDHFVMEPTLQCSKGLAMWVDAEMSGSLPFGAPVPQGVACGTHTAALNCTACVTGEKGTPEKECRGDCEYDAGTQVCDGPVDDRRLDDAYSEVRVSRGPNSRRLIFNDENQVQCHNGGTSSTYAPAYDPIEIQVLVISFSVEAVDYGQLTASLSLTTAFENALKAVVIEETSSSREAITVLLSPGSVQVEIQVIPEGGETPASLETALNESSTFESNVLTGITTIKDIDDVTNGTIAVSNITFLQSIVNASIDDMSREYFFLAHVGASPRHARIGPLLFLSVLLVCGRFI